MKRQRKFSGVMGKFTVLIVGYFQGYMRKKKLEPKLWRGLENQSICIEP